MKKHDAFQEKLTSFVLGELGEEQNNQIRAHLNECDACRQEARRMQKVLEAAEDLKAGQVDETTCRRARQNLLDAIEKLRTEGGPTRKLQRFTPMVQYAAAAVLILGAWLLLRYLGPDQHLPDTNGLTTLTQQHTTDGHPATTARTLEKELQAAAAFFEAGNVQGLAALLQSGQKETKQAAAHYLAQIGDESVLDSLEILASQWDGDPQNNPYQQAIEAIRQKQRK